MNFRNNPQISKLTPTWTQSNQKKLLKWGGLGLLGGSNQSSVPTVWPWQTSKIPPSHALDSDSQKRHTPWHFQSHLKALARQSGSLNQSMGSASHWCWLSFLILAFLIPHWTKQNILACCCFFGLSWVALSVCKYERKYWMCFEVWIVLSPTKNEETSTWLRSYSFSHNYKVLCYKWFISRYRYITIVNIFHLHVIILYLNVLVRWCILAFCKKLWVTISVLGATRQICLLKRMETL